MDNRKDGGGEGGGEESTMACTRSVEGTKDFEDERMASAEPGTQRQQNQGRHANPAMLNRQLPKDWR